MSSAENGRLKDEGVRTDYEGHENDEEDVQVSQVSTDCKPFIIDESNLQRSSCGVICNVVFDAHPEVISTPMQVGNMRR